MSAQHKPERESSRMDGTESPAMTCKGMGDVMAEIELSAGSILYEDTGGEGPVIVLLHGLLMTASLWDEVVEELGPGFRCVRPTLPLGAHRRPMRSEADLSLRGQVRLLVEFLERLELQEVTLVFNDWCGAQLLVAEGWDARVGRLVLASCETYDNYPPGLPGRVFGLAARLPGGLAAALKGLRFKALRRLPMTFGLMSKRPIPDEVADDWPNRFPTLGSWRSTIAGHCFPSISRRPWLAPSPASSA